MLRKIKKPRNAPRNCMYCNTKTEPHYRDTENLKNFMNDRGKILAHTRSGVCSKHQRAIARAIKHSRHLSMLPFVGQ